MSNSSEDKVPTLADIQSTSILFKNAKFRKFSEIPNNILWLCINGEFVQVPAHVLLEGFRNKEDKYIKAFLQ